MAKLPIVTIVGRQNVNKSAANARRGWLSSSTDPGGRATVS
jgi:hypothetical protein